MLTSKHEQNTNHTVSKKEFERAYVELADRIRLIDQRLSTKADEVVLTMALAHRQEIEALQDEIVELHQELKKVKIQTSRNEKTQVTSFVQSNNPLLNWFKKMQFARK
ncbi:hypothetical protein [Aquibacillus salsiterrae]|uniref:Uncharacterized protein n=1 Tax=Aquibacillus salsiterrae TaxID=2950439 RepID=A0A9X3WDB8_9BACI|nr:hypothetical protein [Aquibacillus salsiterrae]MDC3415339.1 hypothetical protein [Aquibacillus salsiterrae]